MSILVRSALAALVVLVLAGPQAEAAFFEPRGMVVHAPDLPHRTHLLPLPWDRSLRNLFDWDFASDKIGTACETGRAEFPALVAEMACGVVFRKEQFRRFNGVALYSGRSSDEGSETMRIDIVIPRPGEMPDPSVVPLPAAGWLLLSALGGLGVMARRRA
jgi:hypothetical protein